MADLKSQFKKCTALKYIDQAKWYLNGFWADGAEESSEDVWKFTHMFIELDPKKKRGCELDEVLSHRFLELLGETLTGLEMRAKLREIDMDANGKMALLEYLLFKFEKTPQQCCDNPQGGQADSAEIDAATAKMEEVNLALADLQQQLTEQKQKLTAQQKAEATVKRCEEELKKAVEALAAEELALQRKKDGLEAKVRNLKNGIVTRNKAAAELAQLKNKDPMPLQKAKLTQGAALRRVERERKLCEAATKAAELAAAKVELAVEETQKMADEAAAYLQDLKRRGGMPLGAMWWMEREVAEAQKFLPASRQKK